MNKFSIEKYLFKYIIKKRIYWIYPFYYMKTLKKLDFFNDLNDIDISKLDYDAEFKTVSDAMDALTKYCKMNGIFEIILKINKNK